MPALNSPQTKKTEKRALTPEEITAVKTAVLDANDRLFLDIEYYFGLRPEECRVLSGTDFDFKNNCLHINKAATFVHQKAVVKETKNLQNRKIPIPSVFTSRHKEELLAHPSYLFTMDDRKTLLTETRYK